MKKTRLTLLAAGLLAASSASAVINIDTAFVGNAGNANDSTGYGYHIGTYEVTNSQYTAFLNATAATDNILPAEEQLAWAPPFRRCPRNSGSALKQLKLEQSSRVPPFDLAHGH